MSTPTEDIREIFARIEHGLAGCREAKVMQGYIEHLTWAPRKCGDDEVVESCRHCGTMRGDNHSTGCPAQLVA